jgi:hypothetical protein
MRLTRAWHDETTRDTGRMADDTTRDRATYRAVKRPTMLDRLQPPAADPKRNPSAA